MRTKYLVVLVFVILLLAIIVGGYSLISSTGQITDGGKGTSQEATGDYRNATYTIQGRTVTLRNGVAEIETAPGSASKETIRYFGNDLHKDMNGDGEEDVAFLLTQETGGSGTFFYVVVAVKDGDTYRGSDALFLGDRIAPQTIESGEDASVVVNYADRNPGEDFRTQPSLAKSVRALLNPETMSLGEWVRDFEGESNIGGKLKADVFMGTLEEVNTGCFADGECYVVVDGKHVTTLMCWSRDEVGSVIGVEGFGDLEAYIGKEVEVYAQDKQDGTYTLYGSTGFYIKLLTSATGGGAAPGSPGQGITIGEPNPGTPPIGGGDEPKPNVVRDGCMVGGCSGQICVDAKTGGDMVTTCEYRAEYACYQVATCERQTSGQCGWTETPELSQCLSDAKGNPSRMELEVQ